MVLRGGIEVAKNPNYVVECTREFYDWETNKGRYVRDYSLDFEYDCLHIHYTDNLNEAWLFTNKALCSFESYLSQYRENETGLYRPIRAKRKTTVWKNFRGGLGD